MLLPKARFGIVLLYNIASLPPELLVFAPSKAGIIALLTNRPVPSPPVITMNMWGTLIGVIMLLTIGLAVRSLLRCRQWMQKAASRPWWQQLPHFMWWLTPACLLIAYPALVLMASGRSFGYQAHFRSMPDVMIWLSLCAVLGFSNAGLRIVLMWRRHYSGTSLKGI